MARAARQIDGAAIGATALALAGCGERMGAEPADLQAHTGPAAAHPRPDVASEAALLAVVLGASLDQLFTPEPIAHQ